jgi:hypothetical protein
MDNKIIEFLIDNNARIDNSGKWLVADEKDTGYEFTVYKHVYGKHGATILYQGLDLEMALQTLKE